MGKRFFGPLFDSFFLSTFSGYQKTNHNLCRMNFPSQKSNKKCLARSVFKIHEGNKAHLKK